MSARAISTRGDGERGVALLSAIMWMVLMGALSSALILMLQVETTIAARHRDGLATRYAAEAELAVVQTELGDIADWSTVLNGTHVSPLSDGSAGVRQTPAGRELDLGKLTSALQCGKPACTEAEITAVTSDRPWGARNPRWQLYLNAPLRAVLELDDRDLLDYVVSWVADDPRVEDERVLVVVHAYGSASARRTIVATLARSPSGVRVVARRDDPTE
jgi:hypothetical protein